MKKLLALILGIVVVLVFSTVTFAAVDLLADYNDPLNLAKDDGDLSNGDQEITSATYDDGEFVVTVLNVNGQATLLAHEGTILDVSVTTGNIQYIDQLPSNNTATFTFRMMNDPDEDDLYTIEIGGTGMANALSIEVTPIKGSGEITISGTLGGDAPTQSTLDTISENIEVYGSDSVAIMSTYTSAFSTKVYLFTHAEFLRLGLTYIDESDTYFIEALTPTYVVECGDVDFSFTVPNDIDVEGKYWVAFYRDCQIMYFKEISFSEGSVAIEDPIVLLGGDTDFKLAVTSTDVDKIMRLNGTEVADDTSSYDTMRDFDCDGMITSTDVNRAQRNIAAEYDDYSWYDYLY